MTPTTTHSEEKEKHFKGHLWEKRDGKTWNWTGWYGTFQCTRCLSILSAERPNSDSNYKYNYMEDMFGKRVPKKKWSICNQD